MRTPTAGALAALIVIISLGAAILLAAVQIDRWRTAPRRPDFTLCPLCDLSRKPSEIWQLRP